MMQTQMYSSGINYRARGDAMRPKLDLTDEQRAKLRAYQRRDEALADAFSAGIASERIEPPQPALFEDPREEGTDVLATLYVSARGHKAVQIGDYAARPAGWRRIPLVEKTPLNLPVGYVPLPVELTREIAEAFELAAPGSILSARSYAAIVRVAREQFDDLHDDPLADPPQGIPVQALTMAQAKTSSAFYSGLALRELADLLPVVQGRAKATQAAVARARDKLLAVIVEHGDDIVEALRVAAGNTELEKIG